MDTRLLTVGMVIRVTSRERQCFRESTIFLFPKFSTRKVSRLPSLDHRPKQRGYSDKLSVITTQLHNLGFAKANIIDTKVFPSDYIAAKDTLHDLTEILCISWL